MCACRYDVKQNADVLFKEVPDGVFSMIVGRVGNVQEPLAIVGGNCSIQVLSLTCGLHVSICWQGFDCHGEEQFWTVGGDNITALALCDVEGVFMSLACFVSSF